MERSNGTPTGTSRCLAVVLRNPGRFGPGSFRPGSFRPESFRPNFGVGRFGLGRWVDSALGRFGPGSFRPKSIQNVDCLGQADKRRIKDL